MKRHDDTQQYIRSTIGEAFVVNPVRPLKRGTVTPFIPMDALSENGRAIERHESRKFTGSGTRFRNGDTLIARITPCLENGKTAFVCDLPEGVIAHGSTEYIVLSAREGITDPLFGYYLARTPEFRRYAIGHMEGTSGRQRVPASAIENYEIHLPPIDTQRSISRTLGALDYKIELNRRNSQTLEAIAQAIFKSWFVDFDPVKAKIAALEQGEDPLRAAMRAISGKTDDELDQLPREQYDELAATAELFPDAMEESELGMIPVGWTWQQIGEIATLPNDKIKSSELDTNNYISTENMLENRSGVTAAKSIPTATQVPGFRRGDVLISNIRPYFKKIWMATFEGGRSPDVLSFRAKNSQDNVFLYNLLYQDEFFDFMMRTSKGAKMPRGDKHSISAWKFPFPSIELRTRFSREVLPSHIYTDRLINQNSLLSKTRNILLPYLLAEKTTPTINMQAT